MNKKYAKQIQAIAREHYMEADENHWFEKIDGDEKRLMQNDAKHLLRAARWLQNGKILEAQAAIRKMDTACRELIPSRAYNYVFAK